MSTIKRIVLFKFKGGTTEEKIGEIFENLGGLKAQIDGVLDYSAGPYSSPDGLNQGYSHGFVLTFRDEVARDGFGPHPEHQRVVGILGPHVEGVLAFDYFE